MAGNKKPRKKRKSPQAMLHLLRNIKMKNLLIEMKFICHPFDRFFKELKEDEEVLFVEDLAVVNDDYFNRYIALSTSCIGFCDTIALLYKRKDIDVKELEPMRNLFMTIDHKEEFSEKEVIEAENAWKKARHVIGMATFGEMDDVKNEFEQLERNRINGIN